MGNEQLVYLSLAGKTVIARRPPSEINEVGSMKGIRFNSDKLFFINEENGKTIY
jgi:hypothetical protein